ncbi:LysR family transcriptional regulator [Salipiger sp. 1_MG-2023]|uniref:LysR family transcriptional regulator n=1 Tax=Salipiger sp. 1_MG-2023 TaxID=3062665 RepID=UPI0026E34E95|nr:LysR family transcriptional regulator [Salipiger sp. 1_MG-2023]MDO6587419.1 LysR family transcriptional regulator [Salipiger sp. 1_MG-2023]
MTLDQIRIFLCVAELCHVTRAAERLNLTQSAVSASIAALERQYDVTLFDRVGRGIRLSETGALLATAARRLAGEAEATRALLQDLSRTPRGRLRIWASQTVASYWLTPYMMRMRAAFPRVELTLHPGNSAEVAQAVLDGEADLGLVEGAAPGGALTVREVGHDELLLILPRCHPLARKPGLGAEEYRAMQWLLREPGSGTRTVFEDHLAAMGLATGDLDAALQLPTNEAILDGVRASGCVSMLSWRSVRQARHRGLAMRRITWAPRPRRAFLALTHAGRAQTRALTQFLGLLDAH